MHLSAIYYVQVYVGIVKGNALCGYVVCPHFPPSQMEWYNYNYLYNTYIVYTHIYLFI